ncbi:BsaA family SipW-dependent biofilm matrix protein [Enterococcus crotali]|uniref:BsaA family SipW-dependent biofilm matrix protein n=1 Tax=Enterococcus crotali TaxID=1453587 RepID=UPI000470273F|nr:BsaA family SipW-dependent biofilm matrix protein [Enterococcus crotali]
MNKNRKKKVLALASGFALVAVLAATFAWFTSEDEKNNHFEGQIATGKDIEVVETFEPPTEWDPGSEVNKDVAIANIGKYKTLIRVSLKESLQLLQDHQAKPTTGAELEGKTADDVYVLPGTDAPAGFTASTFDGAAPKIEITAGDFKGTYTLKVKEKSETVGTKTTYTYRYAFEKDGVLYHASGIDGFTRNAANQISLKSGTPALSYVSLAYQPADEKEWTNPVYAPTFTPDGTLIWNAPAATGTGNIQISFNNITTDPTVADKWYFNSADGYFYYTSVVDPGVNTAQLMDAVKLLGTAGNEYSKLIYDLTVKGQGIAAYKDAVDDWLPAGGTLADALKALVPAK